jgi:amino acid transporter
MKKTLNLLQLTFASTSAIIGSGWLLGIFESARYAGPASIISWLIGGVAIMLIALVYSELGSMLPLAGGLARYPKYTHGALLGFISSWILVIAGAAVSSIEAEASVQYLNYYIHGLYTNNSLTPFGLLITFFMLFLFFLINIFGVKVFAKTNTFLTWFKLAIPLITAIVLIYESLKNGHLSYVQHYTLMPYGIDGIMKSISLGGIIFSYLGFRQAIELAGEAKNPGRDVPIATILSVIIGLAIYTSLSIGFVFSVPFVKSNNWHSLNYASPFINLSNIYGLPALGLLVITGAIIAPFATGLTYMGTTSRVGYAMSKMKFLPSQFSKFNKYSMAYMPLIFIFFLSLIYILPFPSWQSLVGIITSSFVFTYILGPVGLISFRKLAPDIKRPFYLPFANIISPIAFTIGTLIVYWSGFATLWKLSIGILFGFVIFFIAGHAGKSFKKNVLPGLWFIFYIATLIFLSFIGSKSFGGINMLKSPLDIIVIAIMALIYYSIGVRTFVKTDEIKMIIEEQFIGEEFEI